MRILLAIGLTLSLLFSSYSLYEQAYKQNRYLQVGSCYMDSAKTEFIITHKLKLGFRYDSVPQYGNCLSEQYSPYDTIDPVFEIDCLPELVDLKKCD